MRKDVLRARIGQQLRDFLWWESKTAKKLSQVQRMGRRNPKIVDSEYYKWI